MRWLALAAIGCVQEPPSTIVVVVPDPEQDSAVDVPEPSCPYVGDYDVVDDNNWTTARIELGAGCRITLGTSLCGLASEEIRVAETTDGSWFGRSYGWHDCDGLVVTEEYDVGLNFTAVPDGLLLEIDAIAPFLNGDLRPIPDITLVPAGP